MRVDAATSRREAEGRRGNVLLLSLLVLSSVLISAATLAGIIIRDLRSDTALDDGRLAYYAAESGIEQSLWNIRKGGAEPSSQSGAATLKNGSKFVRQAKVGEPVFSVPTLAKDDYLELDLFDPLDLAAVQGIESLEFRWQDGCGGASAIELSYTEWPAGASVAWPPGGDYSGTHWKFLRSYVDGVPWLFTTVSGTNDYLMRVKAQGCDIKDLEVRAFADDAGTIPKDVPSRVVITSTGAFGGSVQALKATMQRLPPLSGLFDYVLFSQDEIVK